MYSLEQKFNSLNSQNKRVHFDTSTHMQAPYVFWPTTRFRRLMKRFRQQLMAHEQEVLLAEFFPLKYVLLHSAWLMAMGLAVMSLQVAIMYVEESRQYYLGKGIWAGLACMVPGLFGFLFGKKLFNLYKI
jgi:hypothetical protein